MVPCLLGCSALGTISQPTWSGHAGLLPPVCQGGHTDRSPCCHPGWHQVLPPSCSVSHTALALRVPRHLGVSELTERRGLVPTSSSQCVQQRVGGAAILVLLQLQRQQGQMGSHPRVFGPSLSFCYLLKINWGLFFENGISLKESSLPEPCPG